MAIFSAIAAFLTGAGGSLVQTGLGMLDKHLDHKRAMDERRLGFEHEIKLHELRMTADMAEHEQTRDIALIEADERALVGSYDHDKSLEAEYAWVDAVRAMVRPAITMLIGIYLMWVYLTTSGNLNEAITLAIIDLAFIVIGWWFAARKPQAFSATFGPGTMARTDIRGPYAYAGAGGEAKSGSEFAPKRRMDPVVEPEERIDR